jgi:hypothetical protein
MSDPEQFAIIPITGQPPADAIMHGSIDAVMEQIVGSKARNELEALIERAADAAEQEAEREAREAEQQRHVIQDLCNGINRMTKRLDAIVQSRRDRKRLDELSEQTEQALALPPDVIDPDAAEEPEIPNVKPGLAEGHEPGEAAAEFVEEDQQTPTGKPALSYGRVPVSYVKGAPKDGATGDLPEGVENRSPPDPGQYAVWDPADLSHPQRPIPQTPTGIGGP